MIWLIAAIWAIAVLTVIPVLFIFPFKIYVSPVDNITIYLRWGRAIDLLYYSTPVTVVGKGLIVLIVFIIYGIIFVKAFRNVSIRLFSLSGINFRCSYRDFIIVQVLRL